MENTIIVTIGCTEKLRLNRALKSFSELTPAQPEVFWTILCNLAKPRYNKVRVTPGEAVVLAGILQRVLDVHLQYEDGRKLPGRKLSQNTRACVSRLISALQEPGEVYINSRLVKSGE